jgi:16S rRNA (cytosine967-C5)-methyltransferase
VELSVKSGQRRARPRPDLPRVAAYDLLKAVAVDDAYANLALPALLRERNLHARDAAFATELAYGTLRAQGTYDAVIGACVDRPLADVDVTVLVVLRVGAHQLLALRVPTHAAVSATVELARAVLGEGRAKFVNAVLRRISTHDLDGWLAELAPDVDVDPVGHLALVHAHPRWVVEEIARALGVDVADAGQRPELEAALAADDIRATVTLVARPGRSTVEELLTFEGARPGRWSPYAAVLEGGGDPADVPAVREGRAGVQDEGSQLVALATAALPIDGTDRRWLDLCAGPGGKAALLAAIATGLGARLTANEVLPHRAELVRRAVAGQADVTVADGRAGRTVGAGHLRPGPRRRPLYRARCAAPAPRGAVAPAAVRPWGSPGAPGGTARRCPGGRASRRSRRLRDLLAGPHRDT